MAHILILDNYDSFTFNLVHLVKEHKKHTFEVFRNDCIPLENVGAFDGVILSPGPGIPSEAGILLPLISQYAPFKRILGICLGMQAIAEVFGGSLVNLTEVYHGVATQMEVVKPRHTLFEGLNETFLGGRYHSWAVNAHDLPPCLKVNAVDASGQIMALSHERFDVCGLQFHPESILTPDGKQMVNNWLNAF